MSEVITTEVTIRDTENDKRFCGQRWQLDLPLQIDSLKFVSSIIAAQQAHLQKKHNIFLEFLTLEVNEDSESKLLTFQPVFICATHFIPKDDADLTQVPNSEENAVKGT